MVIKCSNINGEKGLIEQGGSENTKLSTKGL